jgi:preprotein translocase subunit SecG
MVTFLTVVHILVCLFLILVVLLQAGKGGGMGIAFGGAGSQTVFGSSGAGNFLTRLTSITAAVFLMTSLSLAHFSSQQDSKRLQRLASQRAAEKKVDDEKAAKLKADLEKAREATGGGTSAPGAATTTEAPGLAPAPSGTGLQLKAPSLLEPSGKPSGATVPTPSAPGPKAGNAPPTRPAGAPRKVQPAAGAPAGATPPPGTEPAPGAQVP